MSTQTKCAICLQDWIPGSPLALLDACSHISHNNCYLTSLNCLFCKNQSGGTPIFNIPNYILWIVGTLLEDPDLVRLVKTCKFFHGIFNVDSESFWKGRCEEVPRLYFEQIYLGHPCKSIWDTKLGTWKDKYKRIDLVPKTSYVVWCKQGIWERGYPCSGPCRYYYSFDFVGTSGCRKRVWHKKRPFSIRCTGHLRPRSGIFP